MKSKGNKTNKKAQIFAVGLVLITLIAMGYALYTFVVIKRGAEESIMPSAKLIDAYDSKTKLLFYAQESAKLAVRSAFNLIAQEKAASGDCTIDGSGYVEWSANCKPDTKEIEENFLSEFKKNYENYIEDYPEKTNYSITLDASKKNSINLDAESITINISEEEYNATFTFEPSFSIDISLFGLDLTDFEGIYSATQNCKSKDALNVKNCMIEKIKNWHIDAELKEPDLLFDLQTKQTFFFDDTFSPIKLKFKIKT